MTLSLSVPAYSVQGHILFCELAQDAGQPMPPLTRMQVHNTMGQTLQSLDPIKPGHLDLFVCGPTVYDHAHLGHGKTYTQFDMMVRYWRARGWHVKYVQNITDIDDKIITRAREQGMDALALARIYEASYHDVMQRLGNTSVDVFARATDYVQAIVDQIQRLVAVDHAYRIDDGYYFDIGRFALYGNLSGRCVGHTQDAVSRIDDNPYKRNPGDFCLWKFRKPDEPYWATALGEGRPGWHVEDTAITESLFGAQYDVHGGAIDLIFPHHEAEIAIMESASGKYPLVRHWIHTGFLNTKSEKMSKSLGNFVTIEQALERVSARVLRYVFTSSHYRSTIELDQTIFDQAAATLQRIACFTQTIVPEHDDLAWAQQVHHTHDAMMAHMDHNFDVPSALAQLFELIRTINRANHQSQDEAAVKESTPGRRVWRFLQAWDCVFGCLLPTLAADSQEFDTCVQALIDQRQQLRAEKKFDQADQIRARLTAMGIVVEDTPTGLRWRHEANL